MAFDYKKEYKELYLPPTKPNIIAMPSINYIAVRGQGDPNEENGEYKQSIELLYGIAYTIKMSKKGDRQIEGYLDTEQIEKVHAVGVSLGSLIAQDFANKFPQRIFSLTGLGGYNINKEQKEIAKGQRKELSKWVFKMIFSMPAFRKYIAEVSVVGENERTHVYESAKHFSRKSFSVMTGMSDVIVNRPNTEYSYPMLILVGEKDIPLATSAARLWHQDIPTSQFSIINNAGHCANLDNASSFNDRLMDFIKETSATN